MELGTSPGKIIERPVTINNATFSFKNASLLFERKHFKFSSNELPDNKFKEAKMKSWYFY